MEFTGKYTIPASREDVWTALNDENILKQCIDGCEELKKESDVEFSARVTAKIGPVKAKFSGKVNLTEIDPPNGYHISGEGQGGVAGFAKGGASVQLTDVEGGTILAYKASAEVGGKLASVGSRLVEGVAKKTADDFFGKFSDIVSGNVAEVESENLLDQQKVDNDVASVRQDSSSPGVSPIVWGTGIILFVGAILYIVAG